MTTLLAVLLSAAQAPPVQVEWGPGENHALAAAWTDLQRVAVADHHYVRYLWVWGGDAEETQAAALTLNYVSRASRAYPPPVVRQGGLVLLRVDLRRYAPTEKDLAEWVKLWEEFELDPRFALLVTPDTLKFAQDLGVQVPVQRVTRKRQKRDDQGRLLFHDGGKGEPAMEEYAEDVAVARGQVIPFPSPHLDKQIYAALADATRSRAPVVSYRYFLSRALTTIKDKGIFKDIYGGLYYELKGIRRGFAKGTDLDNYLERLGIGNVGAGVTADKLFDQLRSDQRVAVFRSGVTGKPRRVDLLPSLSSPSGFVSVTQDAKDQDIDIGTHPILNLLELKVQAREVIAADAKGLHEFSIFNGQGALVDEVPPDVAHDRTIPAPYTMRLQPAISCIRCHISGAGWQPLQNDAKKLLSGNLDVFDDLKGRERQDVLDRLAGLYLGDPELKLLPRGRDDYAAAILKATGPWARSKKGQTDIVALATKKLEDVFAAHHYKPVDAAQALAELGVVNVKAADAVRVYRAVVPPLNVSVDGVNPEDARVHAPIEGLGIPRTDWDLVYSFAASRAQRAAAQQKGVGKP